MKKSHFVVCILAVLIIIIGCLALKFSAGQDRGASDDIVILYTNDVHCHVNDEDAIGYAGLADIENYYAQMGSHVILADAGDAIQGGHIGGLSEGRYIIDIMNHLDYDVATIGNHEFDYSAAHLCTLAEEADFPYVCCNFRNTEDNNTVFQPYEIIEAAGKKIAFVGIITPETQTSCAPIQFQNESGETIYTFDGGTDGQALYDSVQDAIDRAQAEGADYIIALAHLGIEENTAPWRSVDVIEHTSGIDVMIDGHSHDTVECIAVTDKDGQQVLLSQTGTALSAVGVLTIAEDNTVTAELITEWESRDTETETFLQEIQTEFEDTMQEVIGKSEVTLVATDPVSGIETVRMQETNLGDFCCDAYRYVTGADVAIVNGGGIRSNIEPGNISYEDIYNVHPFGNQLCVAEVSGQDILDALELGMMLYPAENGSFLQVSGITFEVDTAIPLSVVLDDSENFVSVDGEYRVKNVMVGGEPLDLAKTYTLASHDYYLIEGGGGYTMFRDNTILQDEIMLDSDCLAKYITEGLNGVIGEPYADPAGAGRIVFY